MYRDYRNHQRGGQGELVGRIFPGGRAWTLKREIIFEDLPAANIWTKGKQGGITGEAAKILVHPGQIR